MQSYQRRKHETQRRNDLAAHGLRDHGRLAIHAKLEHRYRQALYDRARRNAERPRYLFGRAALGD
jgi:hypothetical protein